MTAPEEQAANSVRLSVLYSFLSPGLWAAVIENEQAFPEQANDPAERWPADTLLAALHIADASYQHPIQRKRMRRIVISEESLRIADDLYATCSAILLVTTDDVGVLSLVMEPLPYDFGLVGSVLAGARPQQGRHRSCDFDLALAWKRESEGDGSLFARFLSALSKAFANLDLPRPEKGLAEYYPFLQLCAGSDAKSAKACDDPRVAAPLVSLLSGKSDHASRLEADWPKKHLGEDLSHTASREFYVTAEGAIYLLHADEAGGPDKCDAFFRERSMAVLTFLELFRLESILLRTMDAGMEELLSVRLQSAGLRDVARLYLSSLACVVRYYNLALQTTPWRRLTWKVIRDKHLQEINNAVLFKLERTERIFDIFDRLRIQTFLIVLSIVLGVFTIVPSLPWPLAVKALIVVLGPVLLVLTGWRLHDRWWRRQVFGKSRRALPEPEGT